MRQVPQGRDGPLEQVAGGPFSSRRGSKHTLQCPSQILSPDPPHPALESQDPLIPVVFLATDEGVGGCEGGWIRGRKAEPYEAGPGPAPEYQPLPPVTFNAETLGPVQ